MNHENLKVTVLDTGKRIAKILSDSTCRFYKIKQPKKYSNIFTMSQTLSLPIKFESDESISRESILSLNDHCLWELFALMDIQTLCCMPNVCQRFRKVAENVYYRLHNKIKITFSDSELPLSRRALCQFGHLMRSIDAETVYIDVDGIARYCQQNLQHLQLIYVTIDCNLMSPLFENLKSLHPKLCKFMKLFGNCSHLEEMLLYFNRFSIFDKILSQKYPNLRNVPIKGYFHSNVTFRQFLLLNSQLKQIEINVPKFDVRGISIIRDCLPNLEAMKIRNIDANYLIKLTKKCYLDLSMLKKLKHLELRSSCEFYEKCGVSIMESFIIGEIPIEGLLLHGINIGVMNPIDHICKLKTIKKLYLNCYGQTFESHFLIQLASELPLLTGLEVDTKFSLTADDLIDLTRVGKQRIFINISCVENLHFNVFKELSSIVEARESNKSLALFWNLDHRSSSFDVPKKLQEKRKNYLFTTSDVNGFVDTDDAYTIISRMGLW